MCEFWQLCIRVSGGDLVEISEFISKFVHRIVRGVNVEIFDHISIHCV